MIKKVNREDSIFRIRVIAPGCEAKDTLITAMPGTIIVHAKSRQSPPGHGELRIADFGTRKLHRRLDLPAAIDTDRITATLANGVLKLLAPKAAPAKEPKIQVTATQAA